MNLTVTKSFDFKPVPTKGISFKKRKDKIWIGSITFHNEPENTYPISDTQRKELIKFMRKEKTDVLTDGKYFYTTVNAGLVKIEHPEFVIPK